MKTTLQTRFPSPTKKSWLITVITIRLLTILVLFWLEDKDLSKGLIANLATDSREYYLATAANVAKNFSYSKHVGRPYAGHMPGYDFILAPLLWLLPQKVALNTLCILQWTFGCISVYLLARISYTLFNNFQIFILTLVGYSLNTYVAYYDFFVLTESLAISCLITGIFFYLRGGNYNLIISGAFFTWAFFLRPYLLPILVFFALGLFYKYRKENKLRLLLNLIFFMLAFILAESAWVIRNYIHFKKIVPLIVEEQIFGKGRMSALRDFIASIGGDKTFWNPNAEIMVFYDSRINKLVPARYQNPEDLPKYMFTSYYNADSLRKLREWYYLADTTSSVELQNYADSVVIATIERYKTSFIKEKPFYYYIVAPLRILMKFLVHSGTYNLNSVPFEQLSVYKKILKIAYSALYYFTWLFGIIACSIVLFHLPLQHHFHSVLVALTGIYPIVLFPIIYRSAEYRYFALSYPFLFMVAVWLLSIILTKLKTLHKYLI